MFSDFTAVHVLSVVGLIQLLLTLCSVEARPTFTSIDGKDDVSQPNALEYEAVPHPVRDARRKDSNQIRIESIQAKTREFEQYLLRHRIRRKIRSTANGNQPTPSKKESREQNVVELPANLWNTNTNYYRHRNGWGGGYGK